MVDKTTEKLKTGTTTCVLKCAEGIVIAADARSVAGNMISSGDFRKIEPVSENMAVTMAGIASDAQFFTKLIKAELKLKEVRTGRKPSVKEAANQISGMLYSSIRNPYAPSIVHFLLGGFDDSGFHAYDLSPDGVILEVEKYESSGSGAVFVYGVLDTQYKKDMTIKQSSDLAVKAINTAFKRDSASGNKIKVVTITKDGIKEYLEKSISYDLK